jgi:hypothetical protein
MSPTTANKVARATAIVAKTFVIQSGNGARATTASRTANGSRK